MNASRVALYGLSYGGLNTLQGLTRNSDVFAAGVANAPVFNFISSSRFESSTGMCLRREIDDHHVYGVRSTEYRCTGVYSTVYGVY